MDEIEGGGGLLQGSEARLAPGACAPPLDLGRAVCLIHSAQGLFKRRLKSVLQLGKGAARITDHLRAAKGSFTNKYILGYAASSSWRGHSTPAKLHAYFICMEGATDLCMVDYLRTCARSSQSH